MSVRELFADQLKHERWRAGSPWRFLFWGGINSLIGYSIYLVLILFLPYLLAYSIAYLLGIPISYFFNSRFVFVEKMRWSSALKYPLVYVVHYLLGTSCLYLLVQILGVSKVVAPVLVLALTIPIIFLLNRKIIRG